MPPPRKNAPRLLAQLNAACGPSIRDVYALAHSSEYDERYASRNPPTYESPTSRFTHVFHYKDGIRDEVHLLNDRLLALWQSHSRETLAAGFPRGICHIGPAGLSMTLLPQEDVGYTGIWGPTSDHVFVCGMLPPFVLYRELGVWRKLPLPDSSCTVLSDVFGFTERDVYFVGNHGTVFHYDGHSFTLLEVPTTRPLRCIRALGKNVCIGGDDGVLLYGNRSGLRLVPSGTNEIVREIGIYGGKAFYGTRGGVYAFSDTQPPTLEISQGAHAVTGFPDGLLVKHGDEAFLWNGTLLTPLDTLL